MKDKTINLKEIFNSLSTALDFTYNGLSGHHKRVAYMAVSLARKMGQDNCTISKLYMASIIHDIGAISMREKELLGELELSDPYTHSDLGSQLADTINFLKPAGTIIKHHHDVWAGNNPSGLRGREIPLESRLINAVDRLDVLISPGECLLRQSSCVLGRLKEISGKIIDPEIYGELSGLAEKESFWLDLDSGYLHRALDGLLADVEISVGQEMLIDVSLLFSNVIDRKSSFTHRHSRLVAASAGKLADIYGFGPGDCRKMVVAGLLHDLGKLSVPEDILEKPDKLTPEEFAVMKRHTYYTHRILEEISGFAEINSWASFHHERLDGCGYPFRLAGESIPLGSRILAAGDVFSALAEDRPYRRGMSRESIVEILKSMSGSALDPRVVKTLLENFDLFESLTRQEDPISVL